MAEQLYGFNQKDVKRIAEAVRKTENVLSFGGKGKGATLITPHIQARLTEKDATDPSKFAWVRVFKNEAGNWTDDTGTDGSGTDKLEGTLTENPAIEINGGTADVGDRVMLRRVGVEKDDGSCVVHYVFTAPLG